MYGNQRFGYGVYKKNQVSIGNPFAVQPPAEKQMADLAPEEQEEGSFVPVDTLEKARREARLIVREAEFEAERLLEAARDKIVLEAEEAQRRARENGYAEGERQAQQQYKALVAEAEETLEAARTEYREAMSAMESDMVELVLDIATKAIGEQLSAHPDTILSVIRSTMADITPTDRCVVKVSSQDYEVVLSQMDRLTASLGFLCEMDIRRDNSLPRGACVIDTGRGTVDGGVDARLKQMEDAVRALLVGRPETPITAAPVPVGEG